MEHTNTAAMCRVYGCKKPANVHNGEVLPMIIDVNGAKVQIPSCVFHDALLKRMLEMPEFKGKMKLTLEPVSHKVLVEFV